MPSIYIARDSAAAADTLGEHAVRAVAEGFNGPGDVDIHIAAVAARATAAADGEICQCARLAVTANATAAADALGQNAKCTRAGSDECIPSFDRNLAAIATAAALAANDNLEVRA